MKTTAPERWPGWPRGWLSRWLSATLLVVLLASTTTARAEAPAAAAAVVESLHAVLAENLAAPARGFEQRRDRLQPVVASVFDFETITRVALGEAFEPLDAAARGRFEERMRRLSVLTYADRFVGPTSGARFVTLSQQDARRGRVLVRTRLERDGEEPVTLDYVLTGGEAGPRIVNVLANGVSDLSLKRAEYAAVIRRDGVDGLASRLDEQIDELATRARGG